jgi:hypothetical protein
MMINNLVKFININYAIGPISFYSSNNPSYSFAKDDLALVSANSDKDNVHLVFFDSVHAKEHVPYKLH